MKKRKNLLVVIVSAVLFVAVLETAIEALAAGDGGTLFISGAVLWLLGTAISSNWTKLKAPIKRLPNEDVRMDYKSE